MAEQARIEAKVALKVVDWDTATAEIQADMLQSIARRLSDVTGGLTQAGREMLLPGLTVAASIVAGESDEKLASLIRHLGKTRSNGEMIELIGTVLAQPKTQPVDDRLLVGLSTGYEFGHDRAQKIHAAANRGHDMVPKEQPEEGVYPVLICSRCQYELDVCSVLMCENPGVMRPKVDRLRGTSK